MVKKFCEDTAYKRVSKVAYLDHRVKASNTPSYFSFDEILVQVVELNLRELKAAKDPTLCVVIKVLLIGMKDASLH
jgi:hypothetical protein